MGFYRLSGANVSATTNVDDDVPISLELRHLNAYDEPDFEEIEMTVKDAERIIRLLEAAINLVTTI